MIEESRVEILNSKLGDSVGIDRVKILSILYTRIAAGIERDDLPPSEQFNTKAIKEIWNTTNDKLLVIAKYSPKEALQIALAFINLPLNSDSKQEAVNKWIRTSGLSVLGFDELRQTLSDFFTENSPEAQSLKSELKKNMDTDLSKITKPSDFGIPMGFSSIQSVYILLGLNDDLASQAKLRAMKKDFKLAYEILVESSHDCAYLKSRIDAVYST